MSFDEAREDYLDALQNLNELIEEYNEKRQEHPELERRHRLQTVPLKPWGNHVNKRYAPRKMQSLQDGPLDTIQSQIKGTNLGLQDKVTNVQVSFLDRLLGREPPEELNEEIVDLLDDIYDQANRVERISNEVERIAKQSEHHTSEE